MKKIILIVLLCGFMVLGLAGCDDKKNEYSFLGKIIEVHPTYIIVEPNEEEIVKKSADQFRVDMIDPGFSYSVGNYVKITYTGEIRESYPAQIDATHVEKIDEVQKYSKKFEDAILEMDIPIGWNYEELEEDSSYKFALKLWNDSLKDYFTLYYYKEKFGVCGTERREEELNLGNGKVARIGYYATGKTWSDITFNDTNLYIVLINNGTELEDVLELIKTINIK